MSNTNKISRDTRKIVWLRIRQLDILHPEAQRPYRKQWAQKIADNFDPDAVDIIKVGPPNGTLNKEGEEIHHVIDGQHRVAAMIILKWDDQKVPCHYNSGTSTVADYAHQFDLHNTSKTVEFLDRLLVRVTAGPDLYPDECAVSEIVANLGLDFDRRNNSPRHIQAASACMDVYLGTGTGMKKSGPYPEVFERTLTVIESAWGAETKNFHAVGIKAIGHLLTRWPAVDTDRMIEQLAAIPAGSTGFVGAARTQRDLANIPLGTAAVQVLIRMHNKRLSPAHRIEWSTP